MKKYLIFAGVTDIIFSNECTGAVRPVHFVLWKKEGNEAQREASHGGKMETSH
jgi:hypothetical protein